MRPRYIQDRSSWKEDEQEDNNWQEEEQKKEEEDRTLSASVAFFRHADESQVTLRILGKREGVRASGAWEDGEAEHW